MQESQRKQLTVYLVANNLQLQFMWNFSNSFELSGACKSPQVGVVTSRSRLALLSGGGTREPLSTGGPAARVAAHKALPPP